LCGDDAAPFIVQLVLKVGWVNLFPIWIISVFPLHKTLDSDQYSVID
jgi:hypothetical protein